MTQQIALSRQTDRQTDRQSSESIALTRSRVDTRVTAISHGELMTDRLDGKMWPRPTFNCSLLGARRISDELSTSRTHHVVLYLTADSKIKVHVILVDHFSCPGRAVCRVRLCVQTTFDLVKK